MFRFRFVPRLGLCLLATLATFLYGQVNTSSIAGLLTDESGAVVPHAKVTVTQDGTGLVRSVTNSDSGEYVVPQSRAFARFGDTSADILLYGHTHQRVAARVNGTLIVNPGSAGEAEIGRSEAVMSCAVLDLASEEIRHLEYAA